MAEEVSPQQQHVHTTTLSELLVYCFSERARKVGSIPWATAGTDVPLSKGIMNGPCYSEVCSLHRGCCWYIPTRTSSRPLIGIFNDTSSFTQQGANRHGQDTLPLHGENLSLPWIEQIERMVKQLHFHFFQWRGGEKQPEVKNSKRPWIQLVDQGCLHWGKWKGFNDTAALCVCWCVRWSRHAIEWLSFHWREHVQWCKGPRFLLPI